MDLEGALKSKELQSWINKSWLNSDKIKKIRSSFSNSKPFEHAELADLFNEAKLRKILADLEKEPFIRKESDLFKFEQTEDLESSKVNSLKEFRDFLCSEEFILFLRELFGIKLKTGKINLTGTRYSDTDFLLPHDDRLEGRKLAYMIYLTDLNKKDGGSLSLLDSKNSIPTSSAKRIMPNFNKFIAFKVSEKSFHEIEEVISNKKRIALSGWFYG